MSAAHSHWSPAQLFWLLPLLMVLAAYCGAAVRQFRRGRHWSYWRTSGFVAGILLLLISMTPPVAELGHHSLQGHMIQHLLMGMFAPLALVLAAPVTLALRTLPATVGRRLVHFLRMPLIGALSHPVSAALLNVGGMYVLYLTPLYALSLTNPVVHVLVHLHFVIAGCLFTWAVAGPDPGPHRPGFWPRLFILFLSIAAHSLLAKFMFAYGWPRNAGHSLEDIEAAAQLMYYGGDLAELLLLVALFASRWKRWPTRHQQAQPTA